MQIGSLTPGGETWWLMTEWRIRLNGCVIGTGALWPLLGATVVVVVVTGPAGPLSP